MNRLLTLSLVLCLATPSQSEAQSSAPERTERIPIHNGDTLVRHHFPPYKGIQGRAVDVWLPRIQSTGPLALVLAQDGQNIFDPATAYGGQSWEMHLTMQRLLDSGRVVPALVVGIWNSPDRFNEYLPMPAYQGLPAADKAQLHAERFAEPLSDVYVEWVAQVLLPFLTTNYPISTQASDRFLIGSSMGGLISAYLLARLPEHFGGAMCVSTHWPLRLTENDLNYSAPYRTWLLAQAAILQHKKLYMDHGDLTLDSFYAPHQQAFDAAWQAKTAHPENYLSLSFSPAAHDEASWRKRLSHPFLFMLGR